VELCSSIDQLGLIDTYKKLHPMATEYTFFSSSHGTVNKTDYLLSQETHLNQLKRTDVTPNTLSDHHRIKININTEKELSTTCFQGIQDKQNTLNQHIVREISEKLLNTSN
jgi:hypothetical protein